MFSPKMTSAVNTAQNCINICNAADNIALTAVDDINKYCCYVDELDPSTINFGKKGLINSIRIKTYWTKLSEYYPAIKTLLGKLQVDKKIIDNTISTLTSVNNEYTNTFDEFEKTANQDSDYAQQLIVAKNMKLLLDNTLTEYRLLGEKLMLIVNVSQQVFDMALTIANSVCKTNGCDAYRTNDTLTFKNNYADLLKSVK